jgi:hypothetical protein
METNVSKKIGGLDALHRHQLAQKRHDEMIDSYVEQSKLMGKEMISHMKTKDQLESQTENIRKRNLAGAIGRAGKYQVKKDDVSKIYKSLKSTNQGENPSFKTLAREVEKIYSEEKLSLNTLRDWHKKLNRGDSL